MLVTQIQPADPALPFLKLRSRTSTTQRPYRHTSDAVIRVDASTDGSLHLSSDPAAPQQTHVTKSSWRGKTLQSSNPIARPTSALRASQEGQVREAVKINGQALEAHSSSGARTQDILSLDPKAVEQPLPGGRSWPEQQHVSSTGQNSKAAYGMNSGLKMHEKRIDKSGRRTVSMEGERHVSRPGSPLRRSSSPSGPLHSNAGQASIMDRASDQRLTPIPESHLRKVKVSVSTSCCIVQSIISGL